jgi:hypothetical protein
MMQYRTARHVAAVAARVAAILVFAGVAMSTAAAFAVNLPLPTSTPWSSTTNPLDWRGGWGLSLTPDYRVQTGGTGVYYLVDTSASTVMTGAAVPTYLHSLTPDGTMFSNSVNLPGTRDGVYWLHLLPYTYSGTWPPAWGTQLNIPIGLDRTAPSMPTGLAVVNAGARADGGASRATVKWTGREYDTLSGTTYFSIYDDNELTVGYTGARHSVAPTMPPVWYDPSWLASEYRFTIEDATVGWHRIQVTAKDRAGNESSRSSTLFYNKYGYSRRAGLVSYVKDSPDPFYPRIRDGYKDDSVVRFKLNRSGSVRLLIYDAAGNLVRATSERWMRRGWRSIKWAGKYADGTVVPEGTYTMYVAVRGGGVYGTSDRVLTKVRYAVIQRISASRVKVVFR